MSTVYLPREVPDLRDRVLTFMADDSRGPALIGSSLREAETSDGITDVHRAWAHEAATALEGGELFHIQPSMVELLIAAQEGIGGAGFMEFDLPAPAGFAYLAAPVPAVYRGIEWGEELAVAWSYAPPATDHEYGQVTTSWFVMRECWSQIKDAWEDGSRDNESTRADVLRLLPVMVWDGRVVQSCHPDASQLASVRNDLHSEAGEEGSWRQRRVDMFRALCYLLRQRVAETTATTPDRASRRRAQREGREPAAVRVISLRGASASGGGDGSREYVHRWIVRGHWRHQWYPSIQGNRPIWITPYVKGPEDAPLLGGQKVYTARAVTTTKEQT